jgi:hypothetical protein
VRLPPKRRAEIQARRKIFIPPSKYRSLGWHVLRNTAGQPGPLILILHGPPGGGKTTALVTTLRSLGVKVFFLDPARFESIAAGEPVRYVRQVYAEAGQVVQGRHPTLCEDEQPEVAAIVADDADKAFGRRSDSTYTSNNQHLHGFFQALCDNPSRVFGHRMPKIPFYFTCNDLSTLPEPIRRHGRADLIDWRLTHEERVQVVAAMYPSISKEDIENLIISHVSEPIAFFAELRRHWIEKQTFRLLTQPRLKNALQLALNGEWTHKVREPLIEDLETLAREVQLRRNPLHFEEDLG